MTVESRQRHSQFTNYHHLYAKTYWGESSFYGCPEEYYTIFRFKETVDNRNKFAEQLNLRRHVPTGPCDINLRDKELSERLRNHKVIVEHYKPFDKFTIVVFSVEGISDKDEEFVFESGFHPFDPICGYHRKTYYKKFKIY